MFFFFFSSRRRHTRWPRDWSSDVCSSDLRVWIVDDYRHSIFIFSNDGKRLLQTIGEPNVHAADDKHFYRPTFIAWLPDGTFFVADGYANTRVVKFDTTGKYVKAWGEKGN